MGKAYPAVIHWCFIEIRFEGSTFIEGGNRISDWRVLPLSLLLSLVVASYTPATRTIPKALDRGKGRDIKVADQNRILLFCPLLLCPSACSFVICSYVYLLFCPLLLCLFALMSTALMSIALLSIALLSFALLTPSP